MRETDTHIYFWSSFMSNFYWCPFPIEIDGKQYQCKTSEHYYMIQKALYFKDEQLVPVNLSAYDQRPTFVPIVDAMIIAPDAKSVKKLGRIVSGFDLVKWDKVSYDYMLQACTKKFTFNVDLRSKLIKTGNKILVEASPIDRIWGVGIAENDDRILSEKNWLGENRLGKVLMEVRNNL